MSKVYIGIDNSITSPGIVALNEDQSIKWIRFFASSKRHFGKLTDLITGIPYPDLYETEEERFDLVSGYTLGFLLDEVEAGNEVMVGMEGYSYGSTSSRLFQIAENSGLIKHKMFKNKIPYKFVPPTMAKKFATGKGNAKKEAMYEAFVVATGINLFEVLTSKSIKVGSPMSDISDAYWMARWVMEQK